MQLPVQLLVVFMKIIPGTFSLIIRFHYPMQLETHPRTVQGPAQQALCESPPVNPFLPVFNFFIIIHFYFISRVSPASTSIHLYSNGRLVQQLHFAHVLRVFIARFTGDFATTAPEQNWRPFCNYYFLDFPSPYFDISILQDVTFDITIFSSCHTLACVGID